ncbi:MAG TPA: outer membrane beta-barrel protein [Puia sp.]
MKKIYFSLILLTTVLRGYSQTEAGSVLLGGNISFTSTTSSQDGMYGGQSSSTMFTLNPMIGVFPVNNFAVILNTNYVTGSFSENGNSSSGHTLLIGPLLRYYFPASQSVKFFGGAGVEFGSGEGETSTIYQFQAGPAFFINRNLALEFNVNYQTGTIKSSGEVISQPSTKQSQFGIAVGFMVYLGKSKS